ncbi:MAG: YcbK family protein [Candidatus Eisenbacteria bacterium]|nr:DUF882 domain-containing protein [Candidatus Eisenbacteria bacterium]
MKLLRFRPQTAALLSPHASPPPDTRVLAAPDPSRRKFLAGLAAVAGTILLPGVGRAMDALAPVGAGVAGVGAGVAKSLSFVHLHTGEKLRVTYWAEGVYKASGLRQIDHFLRDFRTGEVMAIDRKLLDLLHELQSALETNEPFHVVSGYRSPKTNAMLAASSSRVAKHSLHMEGRAIDIRVPGVSLHLLRDMALAIEKGGVGFYPKSQFVHVDTGRVRAW